MELKHKLEKIFNNDYPGTERFIADVIEPIFGNEIEYINDDLAERENYAEKAKIAGIKHIRYIGDLTEKNYNADNIALLDVTLDDSKNIERSRVNIQQLIRSIMDYRQHLMIVFHYEDVTNKQWRFSYAYKGDSLKDTISAKRYTYVFGHGYRGRTAAERFDILAKSQRNNEDFEKAFSVQALSDDFFNGYRELYADFVEYLTGKRYEKVKGKYEEVYKHAPDHQFESTFDGDPKRVRDYVKKMFGRIVFLYFLQRKGWLYNDDGIANPHYMHDLFANFTCKDDFLDGCLEHLFFYVLNTKESERSAEANALPGGQLIPYLNGGLFERDDIDPLTCVFPADYFKRLFDFLDSYNFTIDENDQEDAEVGIDPEMLGRIFENLLEDNKDKGAFYTPKEIVDYMCRESIIAYLQNGASTDDGKELIRKYIETLNIDLLNERQRAYLEDKLLKVKICDPAIGSGAFPMGLVTLLSKIFISLRTYSTIDQAKMKRYIMQQNIYGVDIEQGAVDIARLRFWLAMVVDEDKPTPLPNLHFKIMHGNSLLETYKGLDLKALIERDPSRIDFITDAERDQLQSDLRLFYAESDHTKRAQLMTRIKQTVMRMIHNADDSISFEGLDVSSNNDFFLWHTWFSDVFTNGGFDIVIGNPPYFVYQDTHVGEIKELRAQEYLKVSFGGKLNAYKLFLAFALNRLTKEGGVVSFIFQNSFLGDLQAANLREFVLDDNKILHIDSFPERDSKKKRVFESAKMSVCVVLIQNSKALSSYVFPIDIWEDKYKSKGLKTAFSFEQIKAIDPTSFTIPRLRNNDMPIIIKMIQHKHYKVKCIEGELNMTFHKKYFSSNSCNPTILKGAAIQRYNITLNMSQGEIEYLDEENYLTDCGTSEKSKHHSFDRIAMQGMTGANDKVRLVMSIVPKGYYLANSCNYILPSQDIDLYALLSLLNSKALNWFFRCFSTNSNVNGYEVDNFPLPAMSENTAETLKGLVLSLINKDNVNQQISNQIDHIVYHLYELTYDEVRVIDPETPITREEYDNFKLE